VDTKVAVAVAWLMTVWVVLTVVVLVYGTRKKLYYKRV
jgi:hypothetical protein